MSGCAKSRVQNGKESGRKRKKEGGERKREQEIEEGAEGFLIIQWEQEFDEGFLLLQQEKEEGAVAFFLPSPAGKRV